MNNFSINKKFFIVFFVISTLLIINIVNSIYSISKTKNGFTQYRDTARGTVMLGRIQANMLMVRINVKDYIKTNDIKDIKEYQYYYKKTLEIIKQTREILIDKNQINEVTDIYNKLLIYNNNFDKVINLVNQRNDIVANHLDKNGKIIEQELTIVMNSAESDKDLIASLNTAKAIRTLLLARLYTSKFLITNFKNDLLRAEREFKILEKDIENIKKEIQNKDRIVRLGKAVSLITRYIENVNDIRAIILERNYIITEDLNKIGPAIAKHSEDLKLSLKKEQDTIGPNMADINNNLLKSSVLLAIVILLFFIVIAVYISKSITNSIAKLQEGLIHFFKYLNKESKEIELVNIISKDEFGDMSLLINKNIANTRQILNKEKIINQQIVEILNTQPNIIIMTNGSTTEMVNKSFLDFFNFRNLDEFKENHQSVCEFFKKEDGYYSVEKDSLDWIEDIKLKDGICHVKILDKAGKEDIFQIEVRELPRKNHYVITLSDITMTQEQSFEIQENQKLLLEQSKLASMGEMIGNIAHQWRQPLSVISTGVTGMQVQKEHGILTDEDFDHACEAINNNAQYLSNTIDDFRNFIKGDRTKKIFSLKDNIQSFLHLIDGKLKSNNIELILDFDNDIMLNGYDNELIQCYINIVNNARDAFLETGNTDRFIFIKTMENNSQVQISIKDNAGGIKENVIKKIFEPYFTTKHKSQGTGLGLHMTYHLIVDGMKGTIETNNVTYEYEGTKYTGVEFVISLPLR